MTMSFVFELELPKLRCWHDIYISGYLCGERDEILLSLIKLWMNSCSSDHSQNNISHPACHKIFMKLERVVENISDE